MNIILPGIMSTGAILSIVALALSLSLESSLAAMQLQINKLAFFKIHEVFGQQIPDLQGLAFALFIGLATYTVIDYIRIKKQERNSMNDIELRYILKMKLRSSLEWGSIIITQCFIYTTLGLALIIAMVFASNGLAASEHIYDKYNNNRELSSEDQSTLSDLEEQFHKFKAIIAIDSLGMMLLGFQSGIMLFEKWRMMK